MRKKWHKLMKEEWNERASLNAMHFIADTKTAWNLEEFFDEGEKEVNRFTGDFFSAMNYDPSTKRMLEIGCGVGRMTRAFAKRFAVVDALDVSDAMVELGKKYHHNVQNIRWSVGNGLNLCSYSDSMFDFVFSYVVFQHIPQREIVLNYITEIGRVLKPGGLFKFQVRTIETEPSVFEFSTSVLSFYIKRMLFLLRRRTSAIPRSSKDIEDLKILSYASWVGNKIPLSLLHETMKKIGVEYEIVNPNSQYTWVFGKKKQ